MNIAIIGATGYSGVELIRLLQHHPHVTITSIVSGSQSGQEISKLYPHLAGVIDDELEAVDADGLASKADLVFLATPAGVSTDITPELIDRGLTVIDISGDFRLKSAQAYRKWYGKEPAPTAYVEQAVYGLSEIFGEEVKGAALVANPGCYPTATLLGLIPAVEAGWIEPNSIIIDGKTGVSGAGRGVSLNTHFSEVNDSIKAYRLGTHQHTPEIEQALQRIQADVGPVSFSTHLIPMTRGIMCTMYATLRETKRVDDVYHYYESYYAAHPFVRIRQPGTWPTTKEVYGSNFCDIGLVAEERTGRLTIVSVIDNIVKGAAGQAIQNMNILAGWDIRSGLNSTPVYP